MKQSLPIIIGGLSLFVVGALAGYWVAQSRGEPEPQTQSGTSPAAVTNASNDLTADGQIAATGQQQKTAKTARSGKTATTAELISFVKNGIRGIESYAELSGLMDQLTSTQLLDTLNQVIGTSQGHKFSAVVTRLAENDPAKATAWYASLNPVHARSVTSALAQGLAKQDVAAALQFADSIPNQGVKGSAIYGALTDLAKSNPQSALNYLQGTGEMSGYSFQYSRIFSEVFRTWAEQDPEAAAARALQITHPRHRESAIAALMNFYADQNPQLALQWIGQVDNPVDRKKMYQSLARNLARIEPQEAIKLVASIPSASHRSDAINNIAVNWAHYDTDAAVTWINTLDNPANRKKAIVNVASSLAHRDPKKAMAVLEQAQINEAHNYSSVLANWFEHDSDQALSWLQNMPPGTKRDQVLQSSSYYLARNDIDLAIQLSGEISDRNNQNNFLNNVASQWASQDPHSALAWFGSLTDESTKEAVAQSLVRSVAEVDLQSAITFVTNLPANSKITAEAFPQLVDGVARHDVQQALSLANQAPSDELKEDSLARVMQQWTRNDPYAASHYLDNMSPGSAKDKAIRSFTLQIRDDDPEAAAIWGDAIQDEGQRKSALINVFYSWKRQDQQAAREFLQKQNYDSQLNQQLTSILERN